jgi:hypothetical protein
MYVFKHSQCLLRLAWDTFKEVITMTTNIHLSAKEVSTLKEVNSKRLENGREFLKMNPNLDKSDSTYLALYAPLNWNGFVLDEANASWVNPIVLDTHRINPFPENQGQVVFEATGAMVLGALEPSPYTGGAFHVLVPGYAGNWDYARTMTNMSWDRHDEDPAYINDRVEIDPTGTYEVTMVGGCGYVFIRKVDDRKEVDAS